MSYLITRTQAARAFRESDILVITRQVKEQVTQSLDEQAGRDARLLSLVDQALNPGGDARLVDQEELNTAMTEASGTARLQAFIQANRRRRTTWDTDKTRMAASIPVFRALIASDINNDYHRNHGQLGYALKDLAQPQWQDALDALSEAIRRRRTGGFPLYEFNRVLCLVALRESGEAPPGVDAMIGDDLAALSGRPTLLSRLVAQPDVARWIEATGWAPRR